MKRRYTSGRVTALVLALLAGSSAAEADNGPSEQETIEYIERMMNSGIKMGQVINTMSVSIEGSEELLTRIENEQFFYTEDSVFVSIREIATPLINHIAFDGNDITFRCSIVCISYKSRLDYGKLSEEGKMEDTITLHHLNREQTEKLKNAFVHLLRLRGIPVEDRGEFNEDLF